MQSRASRAKVQAAVKSRNGGKVRDHLPLAPGVVYEFLDAETERLLGPGDLEPGKTYEMIVSDEYGLRRYRTNDLFLCRGKALRQRSPVPSSLCNLRVSVSSVVNNLLAKITTETTETQRLQRKIGAQQTLRAKPRGEINGLPDLAFVRRRGLAYSFTGEKLTAEQVSKVFEKLRSQYPNVFANNYLTCIPSLGVSRVPHYKLVVIGDRKLASSLDGLANRCDELLSEVNCEYRGKRTSGRLGAITLLALGAREFAERFSPRGNWESQFKFLPLCPHLVAHDEERVS